MTFAERARRLAGLSGAAFEWRPDEFWRATPDELGALVTALSGDEAEPPDARLLARMREAYPDG